MDNPAQKTTRHINPKTGKVYIYSVESYWDKTKKAPRNRQRLIGSLDPVSGAFIPRKPKPAPGEKAMAGVTAQCHVVGPALLLEKLTADLELATLLRKCFPNDAERILCAVYFIVQKGLPLSHCETWCVNHRHPHEGILSSQEISKLLDVITEADRQRFFSFWLKKISGREYLCYDITSVSSYSEGNEYIKYGYNRDHENLPQLNLAMLYGQQSHRPAYYRRMPGNISDVSTLKTTIRSLDFLEGGKMHFVLDRGFYSKGNVDDMFRTRNNFTMALPSGLRWVEAALDKYLDTIQTPEHYLELNDRESLFAATELMYWPDLNRRCYLHIYYNAFKAATDFDDLTNRLIRWKGELETNQPVPEHKDIYERFFKVSETPKRGRRVTYNAQAIRSYRNKYAGFFCILSVNIRSAEQALECYRNREAVENSFDDLKNQLDMKRLRVHTAGRMDSRIFLQFLALIYINEIRTTMQADKILKNLTVRELMEVLEPLTRITYSHRYGRLHSEMNKEQRHVFEVFGLQLPT